ncbi:MAG: hypothetical protein HYZ11_02935 [Candidatus Tectomicrobia bacterium]|uniref:Uncharacterized protein n=1 Tax=Tectimicrobiota bacterium TaxID=2528274 RepID=A0A932HVP0_UNCTE|nr:hypothetical protein [Candidatus Tectomicrobia bacterium]
MFANPLWLVFSIVALGGIYVLAPAAAHVYGRFRSRRQVICPETGEKASIQLDAGRAARTALFGEPEIRLLDCRRWPERRGCGRECLKEAAA